MNYKKIHWIKIFLVMQLISITGMAGVIRFHQRLQDSVSIAHKDTISVEVNPKTGSFKDTRVSDILTLGIDPNYGIYVKDSAFYTITVSISGYNAANNLITSTNHTFKLTYNPFGKTPFRDQDLFLFNNAYKYKIRYTGGTKNGVAITSLPDYIYMDADIEVERYYAFAPYINSNFLLNTSAINIDCDPNNIPDELMITWNSGFGSGVSHVNPESYDLEWTFVNDYDSIPGSYVNGNKLPFDFVNNSTRINTTNTYYRISLVYEHGYILYRLRGVGVDTANVNAILYGAWNIPNTGAVSSVANYQNIKPHQTDSMNWQYNASFAEEGKRKEVLSYYDGSLRNRQSVTKMNSDKNTLVGETMYDFQGRPAINVLPVPVDFPTTVCDSTTQPALRFFPNFNRDDSAHAYSRNDFDLDSSPGSCKIDVAPMDTTSGASRYYSTANPNKLAQQAFLPNAQKYPFTQVEYTPDNTGRIKRQGGVGINHQLNTGHESSYFYGQPNQTELDRMFGSEVGNATHYKENVVIDANGQASISYMNMEGKTIATCLAGDSTVNLLKISSNQPPVQLTVDLFNKNAQGKSSIDTLNLSGNSIDFNTQLLVAYPSKYSFSYNLHIDTLQDACLKNNVCFSCIYDLEMHLYDDCGNDRLAQLLGTPLKKVVGHFSTDINNNIVFNVNCTAPALLTELDTFSLFLETGNYTLSKTMAIDQNAANYYVSQYLDSTKNSCFIPLSSFVQNALNTIDTSNCHVTCSSCVAKLGDRDAFVAAGKGSYLDFDALVDACNEPCKATSTCFATYVQMQTDMSPGGQYGDYLTSSDSINPFSFTLSVYNDTNKLPKNLCSAPANWHYPTVIVNNTTYPYYLDGNGHRTSINIQQISTGIYSPAVVDVSKVYFKAATSTYYTYPENLKYFKDFLSYWNPSWSKSLVIYHPEYCYYLNCLPFGAEAGGDYTTSDAFDAELQSTNTFAKAVTNKFLKYNYHSYSFDKRLVDFSAASDSLPYDPFILRGGAFGNKLKNLISNYLVINGASLSMTQAAAYGVRCGLLYGNTSNTGCINFGDSAVVDSIRNNEWNTFVSFYVSSKQALQSQYLDSMVKTSGCPGYNACFGDSNNTYNGSVALGAEFTDHCQPCSNGTSYLYINKAKRFGSAAAFIPATTQNQAQYQNYLQTGQCPMATDLQGLLNQLASNGKVQTTAPVSLLNYSALTAELYTSLGGSGTHYKKFYWNSNTTGSVINASFTDSLGNIRCTLSLDLSSSGLSSLSGYSIVSVSGLADTTFGSNTNAFRVYLALSDATHHITYKKALGYSSCFNITDCKFQQQCSPNDFAGDLQKLMSSLAANNKLYSNNVSLDATVFATYVTIPIKNQLGTSTSNKLIWNFVDTTHYQIYDSLNPTTKLLVNYINRTAHLNSLAIKSFSNVNSNYYNLFTIAPLSSTNATLGIIEGEVFKQIINLIDTNLYSVSMGSCGYGASLFTCQGNAYKLQNQLQLLLHDALVSMPSNHNVDLTKLPGYSYLIKSELPNGLSASSSTLHTNVFSLTSPYTTQLLFTVKTIADSCPFNLIAKTSLGFDSIVDFSGLKGYGNMDGFGNFLQFKGLAKYKISGSIFTDTIFGQSCLPIKNCCACGTDTLPFTGTGSGTGSGTGVNGGAGTGDYNSASDTCLSAYNMYNQTVTHTKGRNADWRNIVTLSYSDITQGDYCGCLESYDSYLSHYPNTSTPPVSITSYTGCTGHDGGNNSYPNACVQAYKLDTSAIHNYNTYVSTHTLHPALPQISELQYTAASFGTNGFCYCAQGYTAFLQSIIDGVLQSSSVDTNMLHISKYCGTNYQPPCKAYVAPDTGNSGFPNNVSNPFSHVPPPSPDSSCGQYAKSVALLNAQNQYNQYVDSLKTSIYSKYTKHCLGAFESFTEKYLDKQYHYTLYYYDQAGNLIRTVPPEGVHLVNIATPPNTPINFSSMANAADSICYDRSYNTHNFFTSHTMPTTYVYNSLNQLVKQSLPDHDPLITWEFALPNGIDNRLKITGVQFVNNNIGYLSGYINLPDTITPGIFKRGYIYTTSDGGKNWSQMQDVVGSNLNKVHMITTHTGYAVGKQGIILKTIDGAYTWDIVPTYNAYTNIWTTVPDWTDLVFKDSTKGVIVGSSGKSLLIDFTQANSAKRIKPISLPSGNIDNFSGVTFDGNFVYASAVSSNASYGYIYKSTLNPFTTDSLKWDSVPSFKGDKLLAVQFLADSTKGFIGGSGGSLLKTINRGGIWTSISGNLTGFIRNLFFRNDSVGVALVDSVPGFAQLYKTSNGGASWILLGAKGKYYSDMSFYKNANPATSDKAYLTGANGSINRLIANTNGTYGHSPYFGIAPLNTPNTHKSFTSVAARNYTVGTAQKSKVVIGTADGNVYYSYNNADSTHIIWDSLTLAASTVSLNKIGVIYNPTTNIYGITAVGSDGKLYGAKITSPTTISTGTLTGSFTGITISNDGKAYTYDNINKEIFKLGFSGTTFIKTLTGIANTNIISGNAIGMSGNLDIFVVGDSSGIYSEATSGWATNPIVSAPLYDIQADAGVSKAVYAVGKKGTLLQKSPTSAIWKKLPSGRSNNFNAINFYRNTIGVIAADSGKAYTLNIDTTIYKLTGIHAVTPFLNQSFKDVSVLVTKEAFVAGDNGTVLYIHNVVTDTFGQKMNLGAVTANFRGVQAGAGISALLLVGPSNNIYGASFTYSSPNIITNTILRCANIFSQTINKAHFSDANNGYLVGDNGFIRHTADGLTWQIVPPDINRSHLDTLNNVFTYQADQAVIIGQKGYMANINSLSSPALINTTSLGGTPDLNDVAFGSNTPNQGYVVGSNKTAFKITLPNTITSLGTLPAIGSGYNLKALHVFLDNSFMAVGNKGVAVFYNANSAIWREQDPPAAYVGTANFNDVYFEDDQNGFVVGDKGIVLRWSSAQNIQKFGNTLNPHTNFIAKPTKTVLAYGVPDSTLININAIAFSDQNYGFMGGAYPDSLNNADYARYIHDESNNFSTSFWYDALGRMVLSQNSKQFASLPDKTYSYTLYDALGRIMEVGQKAENNTVSTNTLRFTNLFPGGQTNGRVNYNTLQNWLTGTKAQVTHTYYDSTAIANLPITQQNLRKRVSSVLYCDTVKVTDTILRYNHATHYTYDIHGNVNTLVQDNPSLSVIKQRYKRVDYNYDLISGKVNYVYYQKDSIDQFAHKYEYDADNRITDVYTSHDQRVWDRDAKYYYYAHGPLARVEYGQNQVQGLDYAYTIQGWIKGVNSDAMLPNLDMGKDGLASAGNANRNFARDAFGYSLTYFKNDYAAIYPGWQTDSTHRFLASQYFDANDASDLIGYRYDLYNGNIGTMISTVTNPGNNVAMPLATSYKYDQLNRLRQSASFDELLATQNLWNNENLSYSWESLAYKNRFTYDANGNIESQLRQDIAGKTFDSLIYHYNTQNGNKIQNRLYMVNDTIPASVMNDDIDNQGAFNDNFATINLTNNYRYDQIGNLVKDSSEGIAKIDWTVYGKIKSITHRTGYNKSINGNTIYPPDMVFNYDAAGNRISKTVKPRTASGLKANTYNVSTYYVRDAQGNVMSVYTQRDSTSIGAMYFTQTEKHLYGSSRIGIDETQTQLLGLTASTDTSHHYAGYKLYELSNHLGNVLTTISDKKVAQNPQSPAIIYSTPDVVRTGIDSLGGMKIQPMSQYAGNHFTFPAKIGNKYKVDFYFNLANTNPDSVTGDWPVISYDANNVNGYSYNDLYHTGHYSFTLTAPDTLFDLKILYYGASSIPKGYMLVDSLHIVEVGNTKDTILNYVADIRSVSDVSPFGAPMDGRTFNSGSFRYGFNGKEKDDEVEGAGNEYDYGARIYDPRIGRFLSVDPLFKGYAFYSPYQYAGNCPIKFIDLDGKEQNPASDGGVTGGFSLTLNLRGKGKSTFDFSAGMGYTGNDFGKVKSFGGVFAVSNDNDKKKMTVAFTGQLKTQFGGKDADVPGLFGQPGGTLTKPSTTLGTGLTINFTGENPLTLTGGVEFKGGSYSGDQNKKDNDDNHDNLKDVSTPGEGYKLNTDMVKKVEIEKPEPYKPDTPPTAQEEFDAKTQRDNSYKEEDKNIKAKDASIEKNGIDNAKKGGG